MLTFLRVENQKWTNQSYKDSVKPSVGRWEKELPTACLQAQQLGAAQLQICSSISARVLLQALKNCQFEVYTSSSVFRETQSKNTLSIPLF